MNLIKKIVLVTGGFDPLHSGHIHLFNNAAKLGYKLIVGLNSDEWLIRKKGFCLMPLSERRIIIENLKMIYAIVLWDDSDNTANGAIKKILRDMKQEEVLIFANGGDRTKANIPEILMYEKNDSIQFVFGVGGSKKQNSSSQIIHNYNKNFKKK